jgi:hypothetical protein
MIKPRLSAWRSIALISPSTVRQYNTVKAVFPVRLGLPRSRLFIAFSVVKLIKVATEGRPAEVVCLSSYTNPNHQQNLAQACV